MKEDGTNGGFVGLSLTGILPTKNFQGGSFDQAESLSSAAMNEKILTDKFHCQTCPVGCNRRTKVDSGQFAGVEPRYGGPEYETMAAFGSTLLNPNLESVAMANQLCNMYSIDTISTGMSIAYVMEAYDRGLVTKEDLDGIDLTWGNSEAIIQMIHKIAKREGVGDKIAEGTQRMAEQWLAGRTGTKGEEPLDFILTCKGMEFPMHTPRGKKGLGLTYATSPRGADHCDGPHDDSYMEYGYLPDLGVGGAKHDRYETVGKARVVKVGQDYWAGVNSLIYCLFVVEDIGPIKVPEEAAMLSAVTGQCYESDDIRKIGERSWNLARLFNLRLGRDRKWDTLPRRMSESMKFGPSMGQTLSPEELAPMLDDYYVQRGWDENGVPTDERLDDLGIDIKK